MSDWQPIATAPGMTTVQVRTKAGTRVMAFWDGLAVEGPDGPCGAWVAAIEGHHPASWTDGICWAQNDAGVPSDPPVRWRPAAAVNGTPS